MKLHGPFFLEIFSGTARLTDHVAAMGVPVLPPVDIERSPLVPEPADVLDLGLWDRIMQLAHAGAIVFVHLGTPCNTFSSARKLDGGPPPLRSAQFPLGVPDLSPANQDLVTLGNLFLARSVEVALAVFDAGGNFSIENPLWSLLWQTPAMLELSRSARTLDMDFDQCAFGAPSVKPTRLRVSSELLAGVRQHCTGDHTHIQLRGKVWDARRNKVVYRTKLAQEYPHLLCAAMAVGIHELWLSELTQFAESFVLVTSPSDRKRALGTPARWKLHRQAGTAQKALASGYQLKRGAVKPLLEVEMEPGQAIRWALEVDHPFTLPVTLDPELAAAIAAVTTTPDQVLQTRVTALAFWEKEAMRLLPESIARKDCSISGVITTCEEYCLSLMLWRPDRPSLPKHPVVKKPRQPKSLAASPGGRRRV